MQVLTSLNKLWLFIAVLSLGSCIPEELPVEAYDRGDLETGGLDMGERFSKIVFYSLSEQKVVDECELKDWDLYIGEENIRMNPSRFMSAAELSETDLFNVEDTSGMDFQFDPSSGLAPFALQSNAKVYALDLGLDWDGTHLGFMCIRITEKGNGLFIELINSEGEKLEAEVERGTYYSLQRMEKFDLILPSDYDLMFTRYAHYFDVEEVHYLVSGALLGASTTALQFDDRDFESIDLKFFEENKESMSTQMDIIGYDWKLYDFDAGSYSTVDKRAYLIEDDKGFIYKLRFTSYYNREGKSGHPSFEYQLL